MFRKLSLLDSSHPQTRPKISSSPSPDSLIYDLVSGILQCEDWQGESTEKWAGPVWFSVLELVRSILSKDQLGLYKRFWFETQELCVTQDQEIRIRLETVPGSQACITGSAGTGLEHRSESLN